MNFRRLNQENNQQQQEELQKLKDMLLRETQCIKDIQQELRIFKVCSSSGIIVSLLCRSPRVPNPPPA